MENKTYIITKIESEYAYLKNENTNEELFIALALLPTGADVGTRLKYSFPDFEII